MGIILLILKIIGCILLFLVCLLLLVLFAPFSYQVKGEWTKEKQDATAKVSWAFIILRVRITYIQNELEYMIRVFGIPLYGSNQDKWSILGREKKEKKEKKPKVKKQKKKKNAILIEEAKKIPKVSEMKKEVKSDPEDVLSLPISDYEMDQISRATEQEDSILLEEEKKKETIFKKIVDIAKKCYNKVKTIQRKVQGLKEKAGTIKDLFEDEDIKSAIKRVWKHGKYVFKITLPYKIQGWIRYGFDDPSLTGKMTGVAGMLYPFYGSKLQMIPEFEESVFEAKGRLKGRLFLFRYLILGIKIYFDKDLWTQKDRVMDTIGG